MFQQTDDEEGEEVEGGGEGELRGLQRRGKVTTIHPSTVNHHIHKGLGGETSYKVKNDHEVFLYTLIRPSYLEITMYRRSEM